MRDFLILSALCMVRHKTQAEMVNLKEKKAAFLFVLKKNKKSVFPFLYRNHILSVLGAFKHEDQKSNVKELSPLKNLSCELHFLIA